MDIEVNNLPQKIKDDCLLDAMVNLHFQTEYNQEVIEKLIEDNLNKRDDGKKYAKIPVIKQGVVVPNRVFFANDVYRILVEKNTISFNIYKSYPTWKPYRDFIRSILEVLIEKVIITNVDVRYLSHFGNIPLFEKIDGKIHLNYLQAFQGAQYSFQCNATDDTPGRIPALATVVLTDRREIAPGQLESLIDIAVSNNVIQGVALDDVMRSLDFVHICQKHLFFTIISKDFFDKLN